MLGHQFCPTRLGQSWLQKPNLHLGLCVCGVLPVHGHVRLAVFPEPWTQTRKLLWPLEKGGRPLPVSCMVRCGGPGRPGVHAGLLCLPGGLTYVAVVHPDAVAVIAGPALHDVVGVVRLCNLVVGVNDHLGESQARLATESCLCHPPPQAQGPAGPSPASRAPRQAGTGLARAEVREAEE